MNVVDSSGWIEYFVDGKNADFFAPAILDLDELLVPAICMYEVFKRISILHGEAEALRFIGVMSFGRQVSLNRELAVAAAQISLEHKLAMADSFILAIAQSYGATLWTQDEHFKDFPEVRYIGKN